MQERDITTPDIRLARGVINDAPKLSTQSDYYKYKICGKTPNSSRAICLVVVPDLDRPAIKIITAMWQD